MSTPSESPSNSRLPLPRLHRPGLAPAIIVGAAALCAVTMAVAAPTSPNVSASASPKASIGHPATATSASVKPTHGQGVEMLKRGLGLIEAGNKELDGARETSKKANADLKAANATIAKGKHEITQGQLLQKQGRELKKHGKDTAGDTKIQIGQKMVDDGAKNVANGVGQVKIAQATLNAVHARALKAKSTIEEGRKMVKSGEGLM